MTPKMSDVISYLCNVAKPDSVERIAQAHNFKVFHRTVQPSMCCHQVQIHGYVDDPNDDYEGHYGFLAPRHRTFDYVGRNGLYLSRERRAKDDHFDGYRWFRVRVGGHLDTYPEVRREAYLVALANVSKVAL